MDHPSIARTLITGYPHGEPAYPHCPVCNSECDEIFMDEDGNVFACENCLKTKNAWECDECFKEE